VSVGVGTAPAAAPVGRYGDLRKWNTAVATISGMHGPQRARLRHVFGPPRSRIGHVFGVVDGGGGNVSSGVDGSSGKEGIFGTLRRRYVALKLMLEQTPLRTCTQNDSYPLGRWVLAKLIDVPHPASPSAYQQEVHILCESVRDLAKFRLMQECVCNTGHTGFVCATEEERRTICAALQGNNTGVEIKRVVNPIMSAAFDLAAATKGVSGDPLESKTVYHGTCAEAVHSICLLGGFRRDRGALKQDNALHKEVPVQAYGRGNYFATAAQEALSYSKLDTSRTRRLLVCDVLVGVGKQGCKEDVDCPAGYDNLTGSGRGHYVSMHDDRARVNYVVLIHNAISPYFGRSGVEHWDEFLGELMRADKSGDGGWLS
jgi:hypothetical protein